MACKEKERENSKVSVLDLLVAHTKKTDVSLVDGVVPDTVLIVETESFLVNRKKLADFSPYFRAMFYGGGKESTKRQIVINGVHEEQFRILMDFTKTLKLPLNRQNVLGILEAADYLQMEKARLLCCKFLERELHLSNCLGMMAYAWQLGCLELYAAARDVALTHLPAIASDEDFLYLSKESVADLLASDDLFIPQEDLAFEVTLRWATFDPANREDDFMELIGLVRPESLTLPYLTSLLTRLKGSDPRAKLICRLNDNIPASWTAGRSMPRGRSKESLFMIGGPHDVEAQPLYQFNPRSSRWQCCAPMKRKNLTQYSVAAVEDNMLVTGGYFRDIGWYSVDWVQIYRCANGRWADGPALQKSRHSHCSVGVGNRLYVLGGSMDEGVVDSVEVLVLGSDAWVEVSPMVCAVERAAIVTMGSCIYVACGLDENGEVYSGIQRYQMKTDQWDVVVHCPHPRYDLLATELNGALYLFGGQALRLDLDTDEWTLLEEECLDRKFFTGCATTSGQIYLLGERRLRNIPNMVLFDPYIDTCIEIDDAIPCPVPIHGCVSIRMINY